MKTLLTIFTLLFTVMIPSTSFAGWTKVAESTGGSTYYVDFERIRNHDGSVYFWILKDYLKPDKYGDFSVKVYQQGDCNLFRKKILNYVFYKLQMGEGSGESSNESNPEWIYPTPNTVGEDYLKEVCNQ